MGVWLVPLLLRPAGACLCSALDAAMERLAALVGRPPAIVVRDALHLDSDHYELALDGVVLGGGRVRLGHVLARDTGTARRRLSGLVAPDHDHPALWVRPEHRQAAEDAGYDVLDAPHAVATQVELLVRRHLAASHRRGRLGVDALLDALAAPTQPATLESVRERLDRLRSRATGGRANATA